MKHWMLGIALVCFGSIANAITPAQPLQPQANANPLQFTGNLTFYGSSSYYVESSTPAAASTRLALGSGYFYGVSCSSGAALDIFQLFDSSITVTLATQGKALTPELFVPVVLSSTNAQTYLGTYIQYVPEGGSKRFVNGMTAIKAGGNYLSCQVQALLDSVITASPPAH